MDKIRELAKVFKALSNETRLRLVKMLADLKPEEAFCVNALAAALGVSQSAVSQHLAVLRAVDLVIDERRGYFVHYRLNRATLARYWAQALAAPGVDFIMAPAG
ncbi:MAG: helix-turn-helix transcriptional regulator [Chloroflexi bacterium]|nr:helix-turn-helix transcriptional regulator [Chloroflexota bacterium]